MRINTDKNCNIVIYDDTEYPINGISYNNSVSLYIIQQNNSNHSEIIYSQIDPHNTNNWGPIVIKDNNYGYVTIYHIIIPKKGHNGEQGGTDECTYVRSINYISIEEIDQILSLNPIESQSTTITDNPETSLITQNSIKYYYDNGKIYYYGITGEIREASYQELVDINPNACNIIKFVYNFFSVCQLRKCYVALCQKIFNDRGFDRCFNGKVDSQLIYKRDLVWAALNVIEYMVDSNQLAEAQRLLERINGCNGLCAGVNTGDNGCGCE